MKFEYHDLPLISESGFFPAEIEVTAAEEKKLLLEKLRGLKAAGLKTLFIIKTLMVVGGFTQAEAETLATMDEQQDKSVQIDHHQQNLDDDPLKDFELNKPDMHTEQGRLEIQRVISDLLGENITPENFIQNRHTGETLFKSNNVLFSFNYLVDNPDEASKIFSTLKDISGKFGQIKNIHVEYGLREDFGMGMDKDGGVSIDIHLENGQNIFVDKDLHTENGKTLEEAIAGGISENGEPAEVKTNQVLAKYEVGPHMIQLIANGRGDQQLMLNGAPILMPNGNPMFYEDDGRGFKIEGISEGKYQGCVKIVSGEDSAIVTPENNQVVEFNNIEQSPEVDIKADFNNNGELTVDGKVLLNSEGLPYTLERLKIDPSKIKIERLDDKHGEYSGYYQVTFKDSNQRIIVDPSGDLVTEFLNPEDGSVKYHVMPQPEGKSYFLSDIPDINSLIIPDAQEDKEQCRNDLNNLKERMAAVDAAVEELSDKNSSKAEWRSFQFFVYDHLMREEIRIFNIILSQIQAGKYPHPGENITLYEGAKLSARVESFINSAAQQSGINLER